MSRRGEKDGRRLKRPYTKPEVKQVPLKLEEAVLGGCKVSGIGGPDGTGCTSASPPFKCNAQTS